jgi:glycosyltransferase involved in cell wall biosynthesis
MKILVIAQDLTPGDGWGTIARNTVTGLMKRGNDVCVLLHDTTDAQLCPEMTGLPSATAPLGSPVSWIRTAFAIRRAVKKFQPDVIHFAVEPYALAMPIAKWMVALPPWAIVMLGTYTVQPLYLRHTKWLMKRVYKECDSFPVCSEYTKSQYIKAIEDMCGKKLSAEVEAKSPLFRLGILPPEGGHKKQPDTVKRILFVGGVKPRKGVLDLVKGLRAYSKISKVPFHADIIGALNEKSDYTRRIRAEISDGGLSEMVTLHGHASREVVDAAYANADVFAMLSKPDGLHFEGFGVVFIEANVLGIPTIGPNGSGCKEAVDEGVSGFTVDPEDPEAVAKRFQWVLEDGQINPADCVSWAKKHSVDQQVASYEEVYGSIVK